MHVRCAAMPGNFPKTLNQTVAGAPCPLGEAKQCKSGIPQRFLLRWDLHSLLVWLERSERLALRLASFREDVIVQYCSSGDLVSLIRAHSKSSAWQSSYQEIRIQRWVNGELLRLLWVV